MIAVGKSRNWGFAINKRIKLLFSFALEGTKNTLGYNYAGPSVNKRMQSRVISKLFHFVKQITILKGRTKYEKWPTPRVVYIIIVF